MQVSRIAVHWNTTNRHLAIAFAVVCLLGTVSELALNVYGIRSGLGLVPLFNLSYEANIPTLYSSLLLLVCALLLFAISHLTAKAGRPFRRHWLFLGLAFLYISIDEAVMIHENLNSPMRRLLDLGGIFYFGWVVPVAGLLAGFLLAYVGFLLWLPRRSRVLFVTAGLVYVAGAMGTELPISAWYEIHGGSNLTYGLLNLAQEALEILGVSIFCSALVDYLGSAHGGIRVAFGHREIEPATIA